ncbi:exocyst complex component EXO70A1-like [Phragmites australis]|uniref:exocyst complex component EXO70A1-like n=1 Tax=Phragmites australis TaxID=29695 RepID=UPI002D77C2B6|nr:exocyst complex component EXO70A1-like [Phragmites australis]
MEVHGISSFTTTPTDDSRTYCPGFSRDSVSMEKVYLYLIDPEASIALKEIAELIILSGHDPKLCHIYSETRYNKLMQCLYLLGVQIEPKIHSPAAATAEGGYNLKLDCRKVKLWIEGLKIIVVTVIPEERYACAQIFGCDNTVEEDCFAGATTRCTQQLLAGGSVMTKVKDQQYEKMPLLLQMHEELAKIRPSLLDLLPGDAKDVISQEASMLLDKLGEASLPTVGFLEFMVQSRTR